MCPREGRSLHRLLEFFAALFQVRGRGEDVGEMRDFSHGFRCFPLCAFLGK
jgi:hypothetical protein